MFISFCLFVYLSSFQMPDGEDAPLERNSHFITKDDDIEEGNSKKVYRRRLLNATKTCFYLPLADSKTLIFV